MGIIVIGLGIYLLINYINKNQSNTNSNRALDILDERYARGEIDDEEYKTRFHNLKE